jgi:hypothetical protein
MTGKTGSKGTPSRRAAAHARRSAEGATNLKRMAAKPGAVAKVLQSDAAYTDAVLKSYQRAFARSQQAGRDVTFHVRVQPDGRAMVTGLKALSPKGEATAAQLAKKPGVDRANALDEARRRGRERAAQIFEREDMVSAQQLAERLGTTRMTVNTKRQNGQLLGLDGAKRGVRYPLWQLDDDGIPFPELQALRERLGDPWAVYRFLVQTHGELNGLTGLQALKRRKARAVLAAAESVGRGDFG